MSKVIDVLDKYRGVIETARNSKRVLISVNPQCITDIVSELCRVRAELERTRDRALSPEE